MPSPARSPKLSANGTEELLVGNLEAERDFLDVVDVVRALTALATRGRAGATYNVASGEAVSIRSVLDVLLSESACPLRAVIDPGRLRPVEVARMVGDACPLRADTGWVPVSGWRQAAAAALVRWREDLQR